MSERTCRCCGRKFEHPAPASLSTKRDCHDCAQLPEGVRRVLEGHQGEIVRLRREVDQIRAATGVTMPKPVRRPKADAEGDGPVSTS
jgi:hypothetical protein